MTAARMSAMDAAFLAMERAAEPTHLGMVMVFDPGPYGPLTYDTVTARVGARLDRMPSARRRAVQPPLGLARPWWKSVDDLDLEFHIRQTAVPAGADSESAALARLVAAAHAIPLDRGHPLWELWVVEGLSAGRVALYAKVHTAAIDDSTGAELMTALLDDDPSGPAPRLTAAGRPTYGAIDHLIGPLPEQLRRAAGFPGRMATRAVRSMSLQLPGLLETAAEVARRTPGLDLIGSRLPEPLDVDLRDEHPTVRAPRLSWNAPLTSRRRFAFTNLPIEDVLAVKQATGTTFNDVVVAACTGALRRWLIDHDELPTSPVVALVPILVGGRGEPRSGTHVAGLVVSLPTNVADPAKRLAKTHDALLAAKQRHHAVPASVQQDMSLFAPPALAALAGQLTAALAHRSVVSPTINLAITNVPGPRRPVYLAGRPLHVAYPVMSVNDLTPLHIGVQSTAELVGIGALSCRDNLDDLDPMIAAVPGELAELARRRRRP